MDTAFRTRHTGKTHRQLITHIKRLESTIADVADHYDTLARLEAHTDGADCYHCFLKQQSVDLFKLIGKDKPAD